MKAGRFDPRSRFPVARPEVGPLDLVVSPSDLKDHGVQQWCAGRESA